MEASHVVTAAPGLTLAVREADGKLVAAYAPVEEKGELTRDMLREALAASGLDKLAIDEVALAGVAMNYHDAKDAFEVEIGERHDGEVRIAVSEDKMSAFMTIVPPRGGKAVAGDDIRNAFRNSGVVFGVDREAVTAAYAAGEAEKVQVAHGQAPVDGDPTRFEILTPEVRDRSPKINERDIADFRELGEIPIVEEGAQLMRRIPPTPGTPGKNVLGEAVPPEPGRDDPFNDRLHGAEPSPQDANLLVAVRRGQPVKTHNGVNVEQLIAVADVDMSTGNIHFDGTVEIKGEVKPDMRVEATGDVIVGGLVEGGIIEAGGDVKVVGGIIGHSRVSAKGSITARFVESSYVHSGDTILLDDSAIQSEVQAANQVIVGIKQQKKGRIIGGEVRAGLLIRTPILGAASIGVTRVMTGVNPELEAHYQEVIKTAEKKREEEKNLEKIIEHLRKTRANPEMLAKAKSSWQKSMQEWAHLLSEKDAIEKQFEAADDATVEVTVGVQGALRLSIGQKIFEVRNDMDAGVFRIHSARIIYGKLKSQEGMELEES